MIVGLDEIVAWLNSQYPGRDWNQDCQRLVWNTVWAVSGVDESVMNPPYPTATAARLASEIESKDAAAAPSGAIHYFLYPDAGHVGVGLGGEAILMTGTQSALGEGGVMLGGNFGVTTVSAYVKAMKNPYLGWARSNGRYPSIIGAIGATSPAALEKEDEDMPDSMFAVVDGVPSWCILNWATGKLYAVHSQAEADWLGAYMGSVKTNLAQAVYNGKAVTDGGAALYKSKLALFGMLAPSPQVVNAGSLSDEDLKRIRAQLDAGLAGLTLKATA